MSVLLNYMECRVPLKNPVKPMQVCPVVPALPPPVASLLILEQFESESTLFCWACMLSHFAKYWSWFPVRTAQAERYVLVFCFEKLLTSCTTLWNVPIRDILQKVKLQFLSPPSWMWALHSMKLKKETLRWPCGQDKITSRCVHVLGFVYGKQEEMPARVVVPISCHRARGITSLCMNTWYVLQDDSSENDEVFKCTLFFPCGKIFVQLQKCTLFHKLSMFFPYVPSIRGWAGAVRTGNQLSSFSLIAKGIERSCSWDRGWFCSSPDSL